MATIGTGAVTLEDIRSTLDPKGAPAQIVELLLQRDDMLPDIPWVMCNKKTSHQVNSRVGLPSIGIRNYNQGVAASKSTYDVFEEVTTQLQGTSQVDAKMAELGGNPFAFRAKEDNGFIQATARKVGELMCYGNTSSIPYSMNGLIPRLDSTTGPFGEQIVKCESTASGNDNCSMLFVVWGESSAYGIYPEGAPAGLQTRDMGEDLVNDASGNPYRALRTLVEWDIGLCVEDAGQVARVCNIDLSVISKTGDTLIPAMTDAYYQIRDPRGGNFVIYANREVHKYLHHQARNGVKNSTLSIEMIEGRPVTSFLGVPIKVCDALTKTEATVS